MAAEREQAQVRSARFEVNQTPPSGFQFGAADAWRVLVTVDGVPRAYVTLADPGNTDDPQLTELAIRRAGEVGAVRASAVAALTSRMGIPAAERRRPTCSVVLCTRRRPQFVADALAAINALDPPADEVIVVDNDPGNVDCRAVCEAAGVRYVREDRRGQDRARAAGLAHAGSELVAFTDDDVVVTQAWLRPLAELFADASVGAATGVAVGRDLQTEAQNLRESFAGFVPGMQRRRFDWTGLRPVSPGTTGAGANMIFRRDLLLELGEVFPPELDGGTPTRSGGDLYALYRVLAAGRRIVFEPSLYAEHRHSPDYEALRETVLGYGTGFSAFLTKVIVQKRELAAPLAWLWLVSRLAETMLWEPLAPYPGLIGLRLDYLRGGLSGALAWRRSRRQQQAAAEGADRPRAATGAGPPAVARATATVDAADPDRGGTATVVEIRERSPDGRNRAARAAGSRGDALLLFLDPDSTPGDDLAAIHARRHAGAGGGQIVIGRTDSVAASESLAAQLDAMWLQDRFDARGRAAALTFADLPWGNISIPAKLFEQLGGFDERLESQAAAHEFAIRALQADVRFEYEPRACVARPVIATTRSALAGAFRAGADHALIGHLHPLAVGALPTICSPGLRPPVLPATVGGIRAARLICASTASLADALEWCRLRGTWLRLFRALMQLAYASAYRDADGRPHAESIESEIELDLAGGDPIAKPRVVAPRVHVHVGSRRVASFRPRGGQWGEAVAEQAADRLDPDGWRELARRSGTTGGPDTTAAVEPRVEDVAVIFGPGNHAGDDRLVPELIAAGARVARAPGRGRDHWSAIAELIDETPEPYVAITLPGVHGDASWLATAMAPLVGIRVAAVFGVGVPSGCTPLPTLLASREMVRGLRHNLATPPQFAVIATRLLADVGGIDASAARFGIHAPLLDLIDRFLEAGFVVAHQETPGIEPPGSVRPIRPRLTWSGAWASGGLLARAAVERGPIRGSGLLLGRLVVEPALHLSYSLRVGEPSVRSIVGASSGRFAGCVSALARLNGAPVGARRAAPTVQARAETLPLSKRQ